MLSNYCLVPLSLQSLSL